MEEKVETERVEDRTIEAENAPTKGQPVMRSNLDNLSIWESLRRYKVVTMIAMAAAFSASLDGYRTNTTNTKRAWTNRRRNQSEWRRRIE